MIAYLKGELFSKHDEQVVVVANNVGYAVDLPPGVSSQLPGPGQEVELHTHYYLRDNEVKLFGFLSRDQLLVFTQAITVKGVGPRLALGIVSRLTPAQFRLAIQQEDADTLSTVPRLNRNTAQVIIMALKKKVENIEFDEKLDTRVTTKPNDGAVKALVGLGGSPEAAAKSVTEAQRVLGAAAKIEDLTRLALRYLSQNR